MVKVAVLMGGISTEHGISLKTGMAVCNGLDRSRYEVLPIIITKDGSWIFLDSKEALSQIPNFDTEKKLSLVAALGVLEQASVDLVYIALHGLYGEDGRIQGLLDYMKIPFTGSGLFASSLAMDKARSQDICEFHGLKFPQYLSFKKSDRLKADKILDIVKSKVGFPMVLKPVDGGSSEATFILKDGKDFEEKVEKAFSVSDTIMFQQYVKGDEVSCGVLGNIEAEFQVLPPTQIIPLKGDFFDLEAKYEKGACEEVTPPRLPQDKIEKIQAIALKAHRILGCQCMSRTDMIVTENDIYVLETNTLPGMTETSLLPQAAAHIGISFSELQEKIIEFALKK